MKKILREGYQEEGRTPTNFKGKFNSSTKSPKDIFNRPNTELSPSMALRTKVYREGRPAEEVGKGFKLNLPPNSQLKAKGRDLKYVVEDFSTAAAKGKLQQQHMKKSSKDEELFRRGSETTHANLNAPTTSDTYNVYSSNTMQDLGTDRRGYYETQNSKGFYKI